MLKFLLLEKLWYCEHGVLGDANACPQSHESAIGLWSEHNVLAPLWYWEKSAAFGMADHKVIEEDDE
jgi:hypothetical protein